MGMKVYTLKFNNPVIGGRLSAVTLQCICVWNDICWHPSCDDRTWTVSDCCIVTKTLTIYCGSAYHPRTGKRACITWQIKFSTSRKELRNHAALNVLSWNFQRAAAVPRRPPTETNWIPVKYKRYVLAISARSLPFNFSRKPNKR